MANPFLGVILHWLGEVFCSQIIYLRSFAHFTTTGFISYLKGKTVLAH